MPKFFRYNKIVASFSLMAVLLLSVAAITQATSTLAYATTGDPLLIRILTIRKGPETQAVINEHLNSEDFIANFRISVLGLFPVQKHMLNEASIPDIQYAINTEIPSSGARVDYVLYDNEGWNKTPPEEQADPAGSTNTAADIVHDAGYLFAVSPSRRVLLQELDGVDWQKVDVLTMQLQKVVGKSDFKTISDTVTAAVGAENPDCIILAQVNPSLHTTTQIVDSIQSIRDSIDGVSIVWQGDDPAVLDELLTALGR